MAAFPSLTDFKILLKEDIAFKDHLNVFLQLPVSFEPNIDQMYCKP